MIRLSYSALEELHTCERKFQLNRLLVGEHEREESPHLSFGSSYGTGVQSYLQHQDKELALYHAWLAYWPEAEDDKKSIARCLVLLENAFHSLDNLLMEYELVYFEDKPATELSFRLNIDETFYFVGYVDIVLKHRFSGQYVIGEVKTTGLSILDVSPLYKNSGQALGYSIILDQIVGEEQSDYEVLYLACQLGRSFPDSKLHILPFKKNLLDRFNWFLTLGLDVKHLHEMHELGVYPKRGGSCLSYMRPCFHFGTCNLHSFDEEKEQQEDLVVYDFTFNLDDVIQDHLRRIPQ